MSSHDGNTTLGDEPLTAIPECTTAIDCWFQENLLLTRLLATLLVLLLSWATIRLSDRGLKQSARRIGRLRRFDDYHIKALVGRTGPMRLGIALVVAAVAAMSILGIWGLQAAATGLLAGAGFAGIIIGLAAADSLGNVVAGFLIFYNHPFDTGDWVDIDGVEGIVDDVGMAATRIITWDNETMTLPNKFVANAKVKNFTTARKLRRRLVVGVEYGTHLGLAMNTLVEIAKQHPLVLDDPEPSAVTHGFGPSSVDLVLRFYVEPVRNNAIAIYTDLLHQVHDTFRKRGVKIAFPHMQVVQSHPWKVTKDLE